MKIIRMIFLTALLSLYKVKGACMSWNYRSDKDFCETILYKREADDENGDPTDYYEVVNAITSLFYCFFAIYICLLSCRINSLFTMLSTSMFVTGLGSFFFHLTKLHIFGELDVIPMLITIWLGVIVQYNAILYKHFSENRNVFQWIRWVLMLIFVSGIYSTLAIRNSTETGIDLNDLFIVPNVLIVVGFLWIRLVSHKKDMENCNLRFNLWVGFISLFFAGFIRIVLAEPNCREYEWMQYLFPHALWHIFSAYGYFMLSSILFFIYLDNIGQNPLYRERFDFDCCRENRVTESLSRCCAKFLPKIRCGNI